MIEPIDGVLQDAIELVRQAPLDVPTAEHREEVRTALLARRADSKPRARSKWWQRIALPMAVAAAAAALFYMSASRLGQGSSPTAGVIEHHNRGAVHARTGARFAQSTGDLDEIVRLHDGTIDIDVQPLGSGERFRVLVGSSEIEVHGTSFTVTADNDQLVSVQVARGRVEVRPANGTPTVLESGQSWRVRVATAEPSTSRVVQDVVQAPVAIRPRVIPKSLDLTIAQAPAPPRSPVERAPEDTAYNDAWDALRANKFHEAAAGFARTFALVPDGPLADDARFWRAVSLGREGRAVDAIAAFRELVDEHPGNTHRGEASAMLGWLLVEQRQLDEAHRRFRDAANDQSATVRASARDGLDALRR